MNDHFQKTINQMTVAGILNIIIINIHNEY